MNETHCKTSIQLIDNDEEFTKLKDCWNVLLGNSNADTIFLTWEWVWGWWQHFKESKKLVVLVAQEAGQIIGIAPFYAEKVRFFGLRKYTHLEFLGSVGTSSAYLDFILKKGREKELLCLFIDELFSNPNIQWDVLNFTFMKKESENLRLCQEYWTLKAKKVTIYEEWPNYFINLPENIEDLNKVIGRKMRANCRNYTNKLCNQYQSYLEIITSPENHEKDLADFIRLHQLRQQAKNEKGSFDAQRQDFVDFHKIISKIFLQNGWGQFAFLNVNKERVAGQYNFTYKSKIYGFSCGFDPAWTSSSVGNILIYMALEHDIQSNYREFDFLRGSYGDGNEEYKSRWTKNTHIAVNAAFWRSNFVYFLVSLEKNMRTFIKKLFPKEIAMKIYSDVFLRKE